MRNARRRDETRWSDRTALMAAATALPVTASAAATILIGGEIATVTGVLAIVIPGIVAAIATAVAGHHLLIRRQRERERTVNRRMSSAKRRLHDERHERDVLRELDSALDHAANEFEALEVIREAFTRHLSMQPMELHLVDPVDPVLELAVATGDHQTRPGERPSPWDSQAARSGSTIVYDTTDRLDVCPHLTKRLHEPMSAIAVPVMAMGQLLGVLYVLGPAGEEPGPGDVAFTEDLGRLVAARLAILRATVVSSTAADDVDRLTGLPDRAAMQNKVLRLLRDKQSFTVAVADIDAFGRLNDDAGRAAGDRALQLLAQVARKAIRPGDIIGRIGGDEFLFVLPRTTADDATRAFERLREELVLAQSAGDDPAFTVSIGVIGSNAGNSIEEILHRAAGALDHAKAQGGNRVVIAHPTRSSTR
jgi:diguanylate cyclase (GGDEF)-like protein